MLLSSQYPHTLAEQTRSLLIILCRFPFSPLLYLSTGLPSIMVSTDGKIAIAEICVYIPIFILTLITVFRQGSGKQLGWIYLVIFCAIRLAGAGFKIASVNDPTNGTDQEWSAILASIGLNPLLMASLGLLKRV
jgi:hypothetical protein